MFGVSFPYISGALQKFTKILPYMAQIFGFTCFIPLEKRLHPWYNECGNL